MSNLRTLRPKRKQKTATTKADWKVMLKRHTICPDTVDLDCLPRKLLSQEEEDEREGGRKRKER